MSENLPAKIEHYSVMQLDQAQLKEVIHDNIGDAGITHLDLERVRVPVAGGTTWAIPSLDGELNEKILRGVIGYQTVARGYWETSFDDGGGAPPTCYSNDGITGVGDPGGACVSCKFNTWGSDRKGGKGKACRELRLLFLLQEQNLLPTAVILPPTSIKSAHQYFIRLASRGIPYYGVVTEMTLEKTKSDSGISYSKVVFNVGARLSKEETVKMRAYKEAIAPMLSKVVVSMKDVDESAGEGSDPDF